MWSGVLKCARNYVLHWLNEQEPSFSNEKLFLSSSPPEAPGPSHTETSTTRKPLKNKGIESQTERQEKKEEKERQKGGKEGEREKENFN